MLLRGGSGLSGFGTPDDPLSWKRYPFGQQNSFNDIRKYLALFLANSGYLALRAFVTTTGSHPSIGAKDHSKRERLWSKLQSLPSAQSEASVRKRCTWGQDRDIDDNC